MSALQVAGGKKPSAPSSSLTSILIRLVLLFAIDGFAIWFIVNLFANEAYFLTGALVFVTVMINVVILRQDMYPLRWMLIGLVMMVLFSIYPNLFTIFVAFTNFGDGHLLAKDQAIVQIQRERYLPEGGAAFRWTAFENEDGEYALWLLDQEGVGYLAVPGEPLLQAGSGEAGIGELDSSGIPVSIEGYTRLNAITLAAGAGDEVRDILFGTGDQAVQIRSTQEAAALQPLYLYDEARDVMINQETGLEYAPIDGTFTARNGAELRPGFQAVVGFENFTRFFKSPALQGPLVRIITWNFAFAFLSVFMTFSLGLTIALIYNDPSFPGKKLIQSFLLIPYTIPSLITILIWRGLLNTQVGIINRTLTQLIGTAPPWTENQWWAKVAILLVNLWLGYPYFMLICSGALQAIPTELYHAAEVDGANVWQRFRKITLPLLLVAVGPLLVASFTFNFNNFNLIYLFIQGGPPIAGATTRAGHTDILISYVYNLAFAGGRGFDYGLASAVTIVIFFIVGAITLLQFRYTQMWEEVSENV
ncbi:MAG: ABC transporter permease subunit [Anaerolineaceae bacterium]|nr:ABC transporter permease subunit [Anaerolineaceae bacterium]